MPSSTQGNPFRFNDGATYERYMGQWSRLVGEAFLDWLAIGPQKRWLDVGCGNGAFTEMLIERCRPALVHGIDPSEGQLAYARAREALQTAGLSRADAMALPFPADGFDVAVMPLVIFFVPNPAQGVAEMARVVSPGGTVAAYAWDMAGGGFPYHALHTQMRALGVDVPVPTSTEASNMDVMRSLWAQAGLAAVEERSITVRRTFVDFDDYWATVLGAPSVGAKLAVMSPGEIDRLKAQMQAGLSADSTGRITCSARANAIKGQVAASQRARQG
ncbi:class I SAM-dependent methyltransferase [Corticibacter populi]|uniref:Class I SAM-dependent methyltransferase n=1 Tax=Corticibacter populi TaxID=1550736 RepID=A0A3M6QRZ5_9BURK|nr:class I SAM-dependent methyltransferase [Corticibacter populi]RMX05753.1 class I SAM-dependent methyltransferase [Corticibacter populi]RZS30946.1 methyltransferase family protein [Corticibacter populi]